MSNKTLVSLVVVVILLLVGVVMFYKTQQNSKELSVNGGLPTEPDNTSDNTTKPEQATQTPVSAKECLRKFDETKFKNEKVSIVDQKVVMNVKGYGKIVLSLNGKDAPKTTENFLRLVNSGFYDCLTFHRIAKDFVIQGGDPNGDGTGGPGYTVPAEIKLKHKTGSLAMARLPDQVNPNKESSGSQFYIALNDLAQLDGQYTVFGNVVDGLDVVKAIGLAQINSPYGDGPPISPIVMESVQIIK